MDLAGVEGFAQPRVNRFVFIWQRAQCRLTQTDDEERAKDSCIGTLGSLRSSSFGQAPCSAL